MIENLKNAVDDKYCSAVVAGSEMLTRLISIAYSQKPLFGNSLK